MMLFCIFMFPEWDLDTFYLEPKWRGLVFWGLTFESRGHEGALGMYIYIHIISCL